MAYRSTTYSSDCIEHAINENIRVGYSILIKTGLCAHFDVIDMPYGHVVYLKGPWFRGA